MTITTSRVFKAFAWLCLVVGFSMLMIEAWQHYSQSFMRHPPPPTAWSGIGIAMGTVFILFGAGVLQYADTKKALELFAYIMPTVANFFATIRPGGRRSTDPAAETIDPAVAAVLEAEAAARREKHETNPPLVDGG